MNKRNENNRLIDERIDSFIEMLKSVYHVDEYGLADMLGINRKAWTRGRNGGISKMGPQTFYKLNELTGVSIGWLLMEERA